MLPHMVGLASVPRSTPAQDAPDAESETCNETSFPETSGVTLIDREPAAAPAASAFRASAALIAAARPERVGLEPARYDAAAAFSDSSDSTSAGEIDEEAPNRFEMLRWASGSTVDDPVRPAMADRIAGAT